MKRFLSLLLLLVCGCVCVSPACALEYGYETALVDGLTADRVHLRVAPSTDAASLGLYYSGAEALLLGLEGDWAHIRMGAQEGYMMRRYLRIGAEPQTATDRRPSGEVSAAEGALVWNTPDLNKPATATAAQGQSLIVQGETAEHAYYVQTGEDFFYLQADQVRITGSVAAPDQPASRQLRQVLQDEQPFLCTNSGQPMKVSGFRLDVPDATCLPGRFAVADLDRDGEMEVALEYRMDGYPFSYLLLDVEGGCVYGCEYSYRGLTELKQDGTAGWSNGAGNNGFGWRKLREDDLTAGSIAWCDDSSGEIVFFVNGAEAAGDVFTAAVMQQDRKPGAVWYALTEDNLQILFEK